jgi:hypothetical protein
MESCALLVEFVDDPHHVLNDLDRHREDFDVWSLEFVQSRVSQEPKPVKAVDDGRRNVFKVWGA